MCLELQEHRNGEIKGFQKRKARGTETGIGAEAPPPPEIGKDPIRNSTKDRQAKGYK